jgi:isoleucyl-tRNA synthetase
MGAFADEDAYKTMEWGYEKRQLGIVREMVRKGELGSELSSR